MSNTGSDEFPPELESAIINFLEGARMCFETEQHSEPVLCSFVMRDPTDRDGGMFISPEAPEDIALGLLFSGRRTPDEMRAFADRIRTTADDYEQELAGAST